ncbi:MAG: tRNA dihydrouridine(20/20a) synthase DusA [Gammaproteobacteria bacterium]
MDPSPWRLCLAPMMQRTDRHFRYLMRLIAPRMRLYTEMITTGALLHGDRERFLAYAPAEAPLAIQLGGNDPAALAAAAAIAAAHGYDEVNLNCGCPSDRVKSGAFGACLMREPERVAGAVAAMRDALPPTVRVSVKTRLGVDELYSYDYFRGFVGVLAAAGCGVFHVHARKAWLSGLSPRENREIPPLEYEWVHRLKRELPELVVTVNGGIDSPALVAAELEQVDGVMIGRAAWDDPLRMAAFERSAFGEAPAPAPAPEDVVSAYLPYVREQCARGVYLRHMSRHLLNLFNGRPGARRWRRRLTEDSVDPAAGPEVIERELEHRAAAAAEGSTSAPGVV